MNPIKKLQEKRATLILQADAILKPARDESRAITADEGAAYDALAKEINDVDASLDREIRQLALTSNQPQKVSPQEERNIIRFDFAKLLRHMAQGGQGAPLDGIEAEMVAEGVKEARDARVQASGIVLPRLIVFKRIQSVTAGTTDQYGGTLVATEKRGLLGDFYNSSVLEKAGAMVLNGLAGNVDLPVYTAHATPPLKKTENEAAADLTGGFTSLSLTPKRLPAYVDISDLLLMQSSESVETFIGSELTKQMNAVKEKAFFHGGGTSEPTGIAAKSGIGAVVGATNGAAPDWADIIDLETAVAIDNAADGAVRYFTNAKVRGKLKKTLITATYGDEFVWDRKTPEAPLNGYPCSITNAISSTLTKGNQSLSSAIFFGNAADFVIGYWGGIALEMVRDTTGAKAGQRTLVANTYYDGGLLRAPSFAAMLDALTA